jgi:hypothetical protein
MSVAAVAVLLPLLALQPLLPREQLQNAVGVVVGCVNAIAVDLVIAFEGRGQTLPAVITGGLCIGDGLPEKAPVWWSRIMGTSNAFLALIF